MAELLDNCVDEVEHGATFVSVEAETNPLTAEPMLVVSDDGGGAATRYFAYKAPHNKEYYGVWI